jgi:hypothetical protein
MIINKFNKMLGFLLILGCTISVCVGQVYRENVRVLAVENRFALVQLGFDISDALDMEYIVFDSTSSNFGNNIVYVWNDGINDWVKTTMPAFLNGSLFYNKNVQDVLVITDSLNAIQRFGENASWASDMFVIDKLEYPSILNSINDKYKFTAAEWNVFSEKYNIKVENVATNTSRYAQPLWDFSLPSFTVEARENSSNANLTPKDIQDSSVEVVIVDTEFLSSADVDVIEVEETVIVEDSTVVVVVKSTEVITTNVIEIVEEIIEPVVESVIEIPVVMNAPVTSTPVVKPVVVEPPVAVSATTQNVSVVEVSTVVEILATNVVSTTVMSSPVVKPVEVPAVELVVDQEEMVEKPIVPAPEIDDEYDNVKQIKVEL